LKKKLVSVLIAVMMLLSLSVPGFAAESGDSADTLKFAVLSDDHVLATSLIKAGQDFTDTVNSDSKMLAESGAILDEALSLVAEDAPDVLMISGDLTTNGELEGHQFLAEKVKALQNKLPDLKVYVIPGNHDIRNSNAKNFNTSDGTAVPATRTEPEDFKEVYDFIYFDETVIATYTPPEGAQSGQLSYVARPADGYTIVCIDSCCYSSDNTESGEDEHETRGAISADLESWIVEQIQAGRARGDIVVGMMHHNLVPHFSMEPDILSDFVVDDYERLSEVFADAGMNIVYSGHMHANDIAGHTSAAGNTIYDVETGSTITYASPVRFATLTNTGDNAVWNITTKFHLGPITFHNYLTGENQVIDDVTEYGRDKVLTEDMLAHMGGNLVESAYEKILPANEDFESRIRAHIEEIIHDLCSMEVSDGHDLLEFVHYAYMNHLAGEEPTDWPDWVNEGHDKMESGEILDDVVEVVAADAFGDDLAALTQFKGLFTLSVRQVASSLLTKIWDSFAIDENYTEDNNTTLVLPGPDGSSDLPFTDVSTSDWFYPYVKYVYENGIFAGTSATTFSPYSSMTRGMLATVLWAKEGSPSVSGEDAFSDLNEDWYRNAVNWAAQNSIVGGYEDGTFRPDQAVTREEMAVMLRQYASYRGKDVSAKADLSKFGDADAVSDWAYDAVSWCVASGIIAGSDGNIEPQNNATRAEVAVMMKALDAAGI